MSLTPSKRVSHMSNFLVMSILSRANELERKLRSENPSEHDKVLRLEVGQPRTPPPKAVLESLSRASTCYTAALGTPELKKAIAHHYKKWYSVQVAPTAIAVTTGASGAFVATFLSCFDSGDRVAVSVPGYPCYKHTLLAMGVQVVEIAVDEGTNFQPTVGQLSAAHETCALHGVVVASPSNPTGSVLSEAQLRSVARFCDDHSIRLVVDEIYHGIGEQLPATAMSLHDQVVVISSLSKFWCMTGFRVGWLATRDAKLMQAVERTIENMFLCAPSFSQHAAVVALSQPCEAELQAHVKRYMSNQATLSDALRQAGFHPFAPQGAFYLYARCGEVCEKIGARSSVELCDRLLTECRVAATPGVDFDARRGARFVRFSCTASCEEVERAARRIVQFITARADV